MIGSDSPSESEVKFFRYVRDEWAEDYERCGWCLADDMRSHPVIGYHAVLMVWLCGCRLVEPRG